MDASMALKEVSMNEDLPKGISEQEAFLRIAKSREPLEFSIEKGAHQGEVLRLEAKKVSPTAVEYRGLVGNMLIAVMYINPPIRGVAQVTNAKVAKDYWRSGIASRIYSEIESDLSKIGATLDPQYGALSPDAVRFWMNRRKDDPVLQARLEPVLTEMEKSGELQSNDNQKQDQDSDWNGEYVGDDKHEVMIEEWKKKGYSMAVHDKTDLTIFPFRSNGYLPEEYELIDIAGNEQRLSELMRKYE